jgi:hypothetical protein
MRRAARRTAFPKLEPIDGLLREVVSVTRPRVIDEATLRQLLLGELPNRLEERRTSLPLIQLRSHE